MLITWVMYQLYAFPICLATFVGADRLGWHDMADRGAIATAVMCPVPAFVFGCGLIGYTMIIVREIYDE